MNRLALAAAAFGLAAPMLMAQTSQWNIDPAHSEVDFTVRHMSISNVHGQFGGIKGTIVRNGTDLAKSTVSVTIDVASIDTGVSARDNDLKGPHFFDVAKFPTATFTSTGVSGSGTHFMVAGNLTLHGVSHPIQLDVEGPSPTITGMDHKPHTGYSATATINRKDFGIGGNYPDSIVGDQIKLTIDLEAVEQQ
ncbi:MAG: YceI family protein [Acidobacteriota bacterium]